MLARRAGETRFSYLSVDASEAAGKFFDNDTGFEERAVAAVTGATTAFLEAPFSQDVVSAARFVFRPLGTGTITVIGTAVTGSAGVAQFIAEVPVGSKIALTGQSAVEREVVAVADDEHLTLSAAFPGGDVTTASPFLYRNAGQGRITTVLTSSGTNTSSSVREGVWVRTLVRASSSPRRRRCTRGGTLMI